MSSNKSNGGDRVVRTLRVYESGKVIPAPGRPPKDWAAIMNRARAHALPAEERPTAPTERVKNPAKARGGKRAGSGPKPASGTAMVVVAFRVLPSQKKKLDKLGPAWLRARIDAATVPAGR